MGTLAPIIVYVLCGHAGRQKRRPDKGSSIKGEGSNSTTHPSNQGGTIRHCKEAYEGGVRPEGGG